MVKLTKIYTRGGDDGMTSLVGGARVSKAHNRMEAVGAIDESNAALGVARLHVADDINVMLERVQHDLFDLGADIATPLPLKEDENASLRIIASQVKRLEDEIDEMNATLQPLNSFVLPGGAVAAAYLHLARVMVRRAERHVVALAEAEAVNREAMQYINRLSDHLFVLARVVNDHGQLDVLWKPGVNR